MLQILSVNPTGTFSYGYCQDVNLNDRGLVNLIGINQDKGGCSNGSGKTSLFNTICEVLFGENPTGEKGDAVINNIWGKGSCPRVVFQSWENTPYRVTYCRKWKEDYYPVDTAEEVKYTGTALFLDKWLGEEAISYFKEEDLQELIKMQVDSLETDIGRTEGRGVLNFLNIDDLPLEAEGEIIFPNEGCLSLPGFFNNAKRYRDFVIDNQIIDNGEFRTERQYYFYSSDRSEEGNMGLSAIAVQHEIDHFDGKLISDFSIKSTPVKHTELKVGRNDKCPCGSGKKYKKCCLGKN